MTSAANAIPAVPHPVPSSLGLTVHAPLPDATSPGQQDHHQSTIETYLTAIRRSNLLAIGPYLIPLVNLKSDVARLRKAYMDQAEDHGYAEFLRIWHDLHFPLVHLGTPTPFGRDVWMNVWYALLMELAAGQDWKQVAFAVYATFALWNSQPGHLGPRVPVPITPQGLDLLVKRVEKVVDQAGKASEGCTVTHALDLAEVLRLAIRSGMFTLTAWVGGHGSEQMVPLANDQRWIQGVAGDGWTRKLALTRHTPLVPSPSTSSTSGSMVNPLANAQEKNDLTGIAFIRHTLRQHARTPVLPPTTINRLDSHAQRYAAERDAFVQLGVLSPPATTPAPRLAAADDQDQPGPTVTPHLAHWIGTLHHQIGQYHNDRAVRMRDAVDAIRKLGVRKRKEQEVEVEVEPRSQRVELADEGTFRAPGRAFRPPQLAKNKGGRPNDVTRWAMGKLDAGGWDEDRGEMDE